MKTNKEIGGKMKTYKGIIGLGLLCTLLLTTQGYGFQDKRPGEIARVAIGQLDFMIGVWEGEGWWLAKANQRVKVWVKETYRYRGDKDLLDMEGETWVILPDGTRSPERFYSLGIMSYDRAASEYRMWHFDNKGDMYTVKLNTDIKGKTGYYIRQLTGGDTSKFSIKIGEDGVWETKSERLKSDKTSIQVLEFHMKRVK
jgi:hypothetical protein